MSDCSKGKCTQARGTWICTTDPRFTWSKTSLLSNTNMRRTQSIWPSNLKSTRGNDTRRASSVHRGAQRRVEADLSSRLRGSIVHRVRAKSILAAKMEQRSYLLNRRSSNLWIALSVRFRCQRGKSPNFNQRIWNQRRICCSKKQQHQSRKF